MALPIPTHGAGRSTVLLRTRLDRILVTTAYLDEVIARSDSLDSLLFLPDDAVRDATPTSSDLLWPPARWWSALCAEADLADGRPARWFRWAPHDVVVARIDVPVQPLLPSLTTIPEQVPRQHDGGMARADRHGGVVH